MNLLLFAALLFLILPFTYQEATINTVAGNGLASYLGSGPALSAQLWHPSGVASASNGDVYISDTRNNVVRRVSNGVVTVFAGTSVSHGNGNAGYSGDWGPATQALLNGPSGLIVASNGDVYIADTQNNVVRKVFTNGTICTVAGTGIRGYYGDGGPATQAQLNRPVLLSISGSGSLYITDLGNSVIRKVNATNGIISTFAGTYGGGPGYTALCGSLTDLVLPYGVYAVTDEEVYLSDAKMGIIGRVFIANGPICNLAASTGAPCPSLTRPTSITVNAYGAVFFTDPVCNTVGEISVNYTTIIAGNGTAGFYGDGGPAAKALLNNPASIALSSSGNALFADVNNNAVRQILTDGTIAGLAGTRYTSSMVPALSPISSPLGITSYTNGGILFTDSGDNLIRALLTNGSMTIIAGNGTVGYSGDGGSALNAQLNTPYGIASASTGDIYFVDFGNSVIRKISTEGIITTVAGGGRYFRQDWILAVNAGLLNPTYIALSSNNDIYIAETGNNAIRMIFASNGTITTVAGAVNGTFGYFGDGGPAINALLNQPTGVFVAGNGDIYISDTGNNCIRKVSAQGNISTVVGTTYKGYAGDGGLATSAELNNPSGLYVTGNGEIVFADTNNNAIRAVSASGYITTIAGNSFGFAGYYGDGDDATDALLNSPTDVFVSGGNIYIADANNNRIRAVSGAVSIKAVSGPFLILLLAVLYLFLL